MNKKIYLIAAIYCASITAGDDIDPTKYRGGVMGNYLYQASKNLVVVVSEVKTGLPEVANKSGGEFLKGALDQIPADKRREIGADLAHGFIEKMNTPEGHDAAYKLGENVVKGAAGGAVIAAGIAKDYLKKKAVETAIVTGPYLAAGTGIGILGYGIHRWIEGYDASWMPYKQCLNSHAKDPSCQLNVRGLPRRCESPERKMASSGYNHGALKSVLESRFQVKREKTLKKS